MSNLRMTDEGTQIVHDNGTVSDAPSIPFYVYSFLRLRWIPLCMHHKLIFKNKEDFDEHWTPVCNRYDYKECPPSDYLFKLKGYKHAKELL